MFTKEQVIEFGKYYQKHDDFLVEQVFEHWIKETAQSRDEKRERVKIEDCPFCGSDGLNDINIEHNTSDDWHYAFCECTICLAQGPMVNGESEEIAKDLAKTKWNLRATTRINRRNNERM